MDVPPKEVKGRRMAEEQAECAMDICQGTSLPDEQHEAAEGPVVKEQQKAVSMESKGDGEELGSSVVEEQMGSLQEHLRSSVVDLGSPVDEEVGSLQEEENREVGSFVDEEDVGSPLGEKQVGSAVGEEEEVVQSQLEKVGDLLGEEMESSGVEEQGKAESILHVQGEKCVLGEDQGEFGPEQGEASNASAVSDREQGDTVLLTDEEQTDEPQSEARGLKKVTFILEPEMINDSALSELDSSSSWKRESMSGETCLGCWHKLDRR